MRALLTILTALSLATHAMAGCCWHHAQACACEARPALEWSDAESCCQHCHRAGGDAREHDACDRDFCAGESSLADNGDRDGRHESDAPRSPCHCQWDCHGACSYLPPEKSPLENTADGPAFDQLVITVLPVSFADALAADWEWPADPGEFAPPLRTHLLYQVLLI